MSVMEMLKTYKDFALRPPPAQPMLSGFAATEQFGWHFLAATLFFSVIYGSVTTFCQMVYPNWYHRLPEKKRLELPSYVISTLHHCVMVPLAWYHIIKDFQRTESDLQSIDYAIVHGWVAPIGMGYTLADTLCYALPELLCGHTEFLIHHGFLLAFVTACMAAPGHIIRYMPHFIILDTTNIIFNLCWFLRQIGWKDSKLVKRLEMLFAGTFFLLRNVHLTVVIAMMAWHHTKQMGVLGMALVLPIGALQWYWFYKIVLSASKKDMKAK